MDGRVYALLPGEGDAARRLATRLQRHGIVGASSYYADPADLARAAEAELVLDVLRQSGGDGGLAGEDIGSGYRLLFRVLASHPEEVQAFYEDTVGSVVRYDDQYGTDLVATLEAYLDHDRNMNATAAAIYAYRTLSPTASSACATLAAGPFALPGPRAPRPRPEGLPDHRAAPAALNLHTLPLPLHPVGARSGAGDAEDAVVGGRGIRGRRGSTS